jgi:MinD superfamily P-loop ATPase
MRELTVLSGKGGTGKTSVTAALASLATHIVLCDNDVDAANLHLLAQPVILEEYPFLGGWQANIDEEFCAGCGLCMENCHFDAIHLTADGKYTINPYQCEGCRLCERICPVTAITCFQSKNNQWFVSDSRFGKMIHARMGPGEENSGKLVTKIRKKAREVARAGHADWVINDGPPGVGCATISSLSGVDAVLLVTEPSKSGWHDAERLIQLTNQFELPMWAVINKHDINPDLSAQMELAFQALGIPVIGRLPFDVDMVHSMVAGKTIVEFAPESAISQQLRAVWQTLNAGPSDHNPD